MKVKLRFIGEDGSMGLEHGEIYNCTISTNTNYIWVCWHDGYHRGGPYYSFKKLFDNWEEV